MKRNGLRVLLAEDETLTRLVLEEALEAEGHTVLAAANGAAALELAAIHPFDILVTDLAMPVMTGQELISRLRHQRPELPVVVMTGYLPPGTLSMLFPRGDGPLALLHKPFMLEELLAVVARAVPCAPQQVATALYA